MFKSLLSYLSKDSGTSKSVPCAVLDEEPAAQRRRAPRHQAALSTEVYFGGRSYTGRIDNISSSGLTLSFEEQLPLFKGAQVLVVAGSLPPISGAVRWLGKCECGLAFNNALAEEALNDTTILFDAGRRPRPARAKISLPALIRYDRGECPATVENISCGGAQVAADCFLGIGDAVMLEVAGVRPIGGYVRWYKPDRYGLMFNKLLPVSAAEEIATRCAVHVSWVGEVRAAHELLAGS